MERKATTLEEAKALLGESTEPVECTKEGGEPTNVTSVEEAEAYFAD